MLMLKDYFMAKHRMNRKIFIMILLGYFALSMLSSVLFQSASRMSTMMKATIDITQQQARKEITTEEAQIRLHELQAAAVAQIPLWHYIIPLILAFTFLPAVVMRLKDVNWPPILAGIVMFVAITGPLAKLGNVTLVGYVIMALSIIHLILILLLAFIKGTKGANKYGADPLELKAATA